MAKYIVASWTKRQEHRVSIPAGYDDASTSERHAILSNVVQEALHAVSGNNLYGIDPESIRFEIED